MNIENEVVKKLKSLTSKKFDLNSKIDQIGIDSLDLVELITEMEDELGIFIPDEELVKITTIKDIISKIEKSLKEKK